MNKIKESKKIAKQNDVSTQKMKIDHLIISCALIHNAACIYSTDAGLKAFGQKFIDIKDFPPLPPPQRVQIPLFDEAGMPVSNNKNSEDSPF
jgi:hypothetical protein